jgi:hypothetical protein
MNAASVELAITLLDEAPLRVPSRASAAAPPADGGAPAAAAAAAAAAAGFPLRVEATDYVPRDDLAAIGAAARKRARAEAAAVDGASGGSAAAAALRAVGAPSGAALAAKQARLRSLEQRLKLSWADEAGGEAAPEDIAPELARLRTVILKNAFDAGAAAAAEAAAPGRGRAAFVAEIEADLLPEIEASCGALASAKTHSAHPEGIVELEFREPAGAAACVARIGGRFFAGRRLVAQFWDEVTG